MTNIFHSDPVEVTNTIKVELGENTLAALSKAISDAVNHHTFNIDARGSTDPEQVQARVKRETASFSKSSIKEHWTRGLTK